MTPTRVDSCFERLRQKKQKGFVAYITAGDPDARQTVERVWRLEEAGADIVELGLPFSDPLADGRVNQDSATRALEGGTTYGGILKMVERIRTRSDIPLIFFSYINPLLTPSFNVKARQARDAGVDGFLLLDLPAEEAGDCVKTLRELALSNVTLVTPTTPDRRARGIVRHASGFVYCVSREGVTGMQTKLGSGALDLVRRVRCLTPLPVVLGFGISTPEQARAAAHAADAVVIGSAIVDHFHRAGSNRARKAEVMSWLRQVARAIHSV